MKYGWPTVKARVQALLGMPFLISIFILGHHGHAKAKLDFR